MATIGASFFLRVHRLDAEGLVSRFDMMGKRLYKTYRGLSNIIIRISNGTPEGKEHALLINSHLDSTLPSPGAADDAIAVGIMLDCLRVLIDTPDWEPTHALVFRMSPVCYLSLTWYLTF